VCIQQTVIDLLERNYEVHVVADATSSRSQLDRILALQVASFHCAYFVGALADGPETQRGSLLARVGSQFRTDSCTELLESLLE
jgi:Isochorismatase family